jgi:hypothetical protein
MWRNSTEDVGAEAPTQRQELHFRLSAGNGAAGED